MSCSDCLSANYREAKPVLSLLQVDMPVFFYIDPEFNEDPAMAKVDEITLSYTFFEAREGEDLPLPTPSHQLRTP